MPQLLLPIIPEGATRINDLISVVWEGQEWIYFCGINPIFRHSQDDRPSFRMFTAQLVCQGACRQVDIVRAFGVSANSVKRSVKKYHTEGISGFYRARQTRGSTVMTDEVTAQAQALLSQGSSRREVAEELGIRCDTLRKAINQGRLREPDRSAALTSSDEVAHAPGTHATNASSSMPWDKSERSVADAAAEMGVACTRPADRVLAALGVLQGAPTRFEDCRDVSFGGVLCALPALASNGLFDHLEKAFPSLGGYYTTLQVITLLANMALCRIKTVEQLQYEAPGELGKLMGLDRVPEVRCLRKKLSQLSQNNAPEEWSALLSHQWLQADPELAGTLYVDGHVRLYHGKKTELPRRYVARQRLCLRGTTDYWTNDALGQPFFCVSRPIDHGMLEALRSDIVPRLLNDVPQQPNQQQLEADPHLSRFVIIFDREGYSPVFFKEMWQEHRIACVTYHKFPKGEWALHEFSDTQVTLANGECVAMKLAERGSWVGHRRNGFWVREVRKLTKTGHQVSLISSAYGHLALQDAAGLFSRWSQENFFGYMMQHYAIDLLSEYRTEEIPETNRPVVNPRWRDLDGRVRSLKGKLQRQQAEFAAHTLHPDTDPEQIPQWEKRQSEFIETIQQLEHELEEVKNQRKETPKHIKWDEFPAEEKFERLAPSRKRLTDTIKMIAYRAETALASIVRESLARQHDARSLVRDLFRTEADIAVDTHRGVLTIAVHSMANPRSNRAIEQLLAQLNAAELNYPGTTLKLVYQLVGQSPD